MNEKKERLQEKIEKQFDSCFMTAKQVQFLLDISSSSLSRLIASNSISYSKTGKSSNSRLIFNSEDIVDFIFHNYTKSYILNN